MAEATETRLGAGAAPADAPSAAGVAAAFPQLEILELIGQGGMGCVFRARQPQLNRLVALKILPEPLARRPAFADRFAREAQALAALNHPNIVTIHDFGRAGGFFYLLMEYVDGVNLRELLRARRLTPEEALAIVPPLCDALQFAHEHGIVHRDIKPENLLLDKSGRVKVADFGIAKMLTEADSGGPVLGASGVDGAAGSATQLPGAGTPRYMAPEQQRPPHRVDRRADIYSLGVVLYEMLTGELPAPAIAAPSAHARGLRIDVRLDEIVLRALETEPERRYQHAAEVRTAVEAWTQANAGRSAPLAVDANRESGAVRGQRYAHFAAGAFLLGTLGTLALLTLTHRDAWALAFGGVALAFALAGGILSWRQRLGRSVVVAVSVVLVGCGLTIAVLTELLPFFPGRSAIMRAEQERRTALARQEAERERQWSRGLGPTIERSLRGFKSGAGDEALDLDAGIAFAVPKGIESGEPDARLRWLRERGVDLVLGEDETSVALGGVGVQLVPLRGEDWATATADSLRAALNAAPAEAQEQEGGILIYRLGSAPRWPVTFAVRTSTGNVGVLRCLGLTANPSAVSLQYRLLRPARPEDPAPTSAR